MLIPGEEFIARLAPQAISVAKHRKPVQCAYFGEKPDAVNCGLRPEMYRDHNFFAHLLIQGAEVIAVASKYTSLGRHTLIFPGGKDWDWQVKSARKVRIIANVQFVVIIAWI